MSESPAIHPTALVAGDVAPGCVIGAYTVIHPDVKLMPGVVIGSHCSIGPDTVIGENTQIGPSTVITGTVRIGRECRISSHVSLGGPPQHVAPKTRDGVVVIGDRVVLREFSSVHMPALEARTAIGDDCFIMAYCHVSHDAEVGNNVTMAIGATLAGHVKVESFATLGMQAVVHQFLRIGSHAMIGMNATITKNVWPYSMMIGETFKKINENGLRKHGLEDRIPAIKSAYDLIRENVQKAEHVQDDVITSFYRAARVPKFYPPRIG